MKKILLSLALFSLSAFGQQTTDGRTIRAGTLPLTAVKAQPNCTFVANTSGAPNSPSAITCAAAKSALGITYSDINGKPTTAIGFGILDVYSKTEADARYAPALVPYSSLPAQPGATLLGRYNNGVGVAQVITLGSGLSLDSNTGVLTATGGSGGGASGTVTSVQCGTGLSGGTITTSGVCSLAASGVTPGVVGSSTQIPVLSVDAFGRVTGATTAALPAAPVQSVAGKTGAVTLVVADVAGAAPTASPAFTGTPTAPTAATADNSTQVATTGFVKAQGYAPTVSPVFTGTPTAPTALAADSSTQIATTGFVKAQSYTTAAQAAAAAPVQSVAGRTGNVLLSSTDIAGLGNAATKSTGTAAGTVAAGDDPRLSDTRVPTDGTVTDAKVASNAAIAESKLALASDAVATTASRRTLGTGPLQAAAGTAPAAAVAAHVAAADPHGDRAFSTNRANHTGTQLASSISDLAPSATIDTTNAANISSGTLSALRMPAFSSDCTTTAGSTAITCTKTGGVAFSVLATTAPGVGVATFLGTPTSANLRATVADESGTGALLFANGNIGAGTATTPITSDNSTSIATTAFVKAQQYLTSVTAGDSSIAIGGTVQAPTIVATGVFPGGYVTTTSSALSDTLDDGILIPHTSAGVTTYDLLVRKAGGGFYLRQNAATSPTRSGDSALGSAAPLDASDFTIGLVSIKPQTQTDIFSTVGTATWTKPVWARTVESSCISGGGGGASGAVNASGTPSSGGTGGNAGVWNFKVFDAADLPSTVTVTVGPGGTGGAAVSTNSTGGNPGGTGGSSSFGPFLVSNSTSGGNAGTGAGGAASTPSSQAANSTFAISNIPGAVSLTAAASSSSNVANGPGAGGSGGSISSAGVALSGANGGNGYSQGGSTYRANGGTAGTSTTLTGGAGQVKQIAKYGFGSGGGGGFPATTGIAGSGGAGGAPGGGGGGGAAALNGGTSGKGGDGGDGECRIVSRS